MSGGTYYSEDYHSLRDDRVDDHRAEDAIVLTEIHRYLCGLGHAAAVDVDRNHAGLRLTDVESEFLEAFLKSVGHVPALLAELVAFR